MKNAIKSLVHGFISWYLNRVDRAFHVHPYGNLGRYVVIMTENQYHEFREKVSWTAEKAVEHGVQSDGSLREPTIIKSFPMRDAFPVGRKTRRR